MNEVPYLTPLQQAAAIAGAAVLFVVVVSLIRQRRLREDYGAVWFAASVAALLLAIWQDGLRLVARALNAVTLTAPLFLFGILFLTAVGIHFSVRLSRMSDDLKRLGREVALLRADEGPGTEAHREAGPETNRGSGSGTM